jgi:hypothetical protein
LAELVLSHNRRLSLLEKRQVQHALERHCYHRATGLMARRPYTRHGLNALMARVSLKGLRAIDRRTAPARAVLDFRRELLEDLGGEPAVSAAQLALVDVAARTRLYLDHVDAVLLERRSLIVRRTRLLPLVEQRGRLADSLARVLGQLGLERRPPTAPSLEAYVREQYSTNDAATKLQIPARRDDRAVAKARTRPPISTSVLAGATATRLPVETASGRL